MSHDAAAEKHLSNSFFGASLADADPEIARAIELELGRQRDEIELIASENIVSRAVLEAQGSVMTNKYAEGYPGRRYYGGCQFVDIAEKLAIERACRLFGCGFANVQPQLRQPGQPGRVHGADAAGRHLHGPRPRRRRAPDPWRAGQPCPASGSTSSPTACCVVDQLIDYDDARAARRASTSPKVIVAGGSAYARHLGLRPLPRHRRCGRRHASWSTWRILPASLRAAPIPRHFPHAHVATTTTHKTLRGPRGGMILTNDEALAKKFNSAVFPGLQGGPLMHVIAAKAVAFGEALQPRVQDSTPAPSSRTPGALAETLRTKGFDLVTGGTDNHLMLVDLRSKKVTGKAAEAALGRAHITCNKNGIPFDPEKPMVTVRHPPRHARRRPRAASASPSSSKVGELIAEVLDGLSQNGEEGNAAVEQAVKAKVHELTGRFPIY